MSVEISPTPSNRDVVIQRCYKWSIACFPRRKKKLAGNIIKNLPQETLTPRYINSHYQWFREETNT